MTANNQLLLQDQVRETFREALNIEPPEPHLDLFDTCGLDSLMFIILLEALENKFRIRIDLENVDLDEFQSLASITSFIARYGKVR